MSTHLTWVVSHSAFLPYLASGLANNLASGRVRYSAAQHKSLDRSAAVHSPCSACLGLKELIHLILERLLFSHSECHPSK